MKNWMFLTVCLSFIAVACEAQPTATPQAAQTSEMKEAPAAACDKEASAACPDSKKEACVTSQPAEESACATCPAAEESACTTCPASQPASAPADPRPAAEMERWESMEQYYRDLMSEIELTDDQIAQINAALDALEAATIDWYARNGKTYEELREQIRAAQEAGDNEKAKELLNQLSNLEMEFQKINMELDVTQTVKSLLTEEQQVDYLEFGLFRFVLKQFPDYEFTEQQLESIHGYSRKAAEEMSAAKGQRPDDFFIGQMMNGILDNVFTTEQRTIFETGRLVKYANASFMGLALTDEQNQQISELAKEAAVKLVAAEGEAAKKDVVTAYLEGIRDNVLTDDQRVEMEAGKVYGTVIRMFRPTVRNPDQRKAIHELCKETAAQTLKTEDPRLKAQLIIQLRDRVYDEVLTEEQKNQVHALELQNLSMQKYGQCRLTPEQTKRVEELSKQMSSKLTATADAQIRAQLASEFVDSLAHTVLTPQQRDLLAPTSRPATMPASLPANPEEASSQPTE